MIAKDAVELYTLFDQHGIQVWIDGGWGVDALLGRQTRKHDDLDVALRHSNVSALCKLLEDYGYRHVPSGGSWGCNFVLGDDQGHRIDVHSFELGTTDVSDFASRLPRATAALIPVIILWPCHSVMFRKPAKLFIRSLSTFWIRAGMCATRLIRCRSLDPLCKFVDYVDKPRL